MDEARAPAVPGYEMVGILGQGGFGIVYRARQLAVGREVALKVDNRVLVSERDVRRFMREVTSAGALSGHPHVAAVYDAGLLSDGRPFMVLELCPGGSLADRLKRHGPLSVREVRDIGVKIADALAAAHAAGVLHRDVKPANILINSYGMVALSDFGLATMPDQGGDVSVTRESLTPAYAPPEAFDLTEPTAGGDVYALAATLYALLSGRPPRFPESGVVNIAVIMALHRLPIPDIPGVPYALTDVLRQGMASDLGQRIQTVGALRDALAALHLDGSAPAPGSIPDQRPPTTMKLPGATHSEIGGPGVVPPPNAPMPAVPPPRYAVTGPSGYAASAPRHPGSAYPGAGAVADPRQAMTSPNAVAAAHPGSPAKVSVGLTTQFSRPRRSRQSVLFGVIATLFALLLVAGIALLIFEGQNTGLQTGLTGTATADPTGTADAKPTGTATGNRTGTADLGVPVRTANCAAATVIGANGACVAEPECWGGTVSIAGDVTARTIPCTQPHYWETFALARLPAAVTTSDEDTVAANPTVARLCRMAVLLRARSAAAKRITADKWRISVLPPSAATYAAGGRTYRCIGTVTGTERAGSYFSG